MSSKVFIYFMEELPVIYTTIVIFGQVWVSLYWTGSFTLIYTWILSKSQLIIHTINNGNHTMSPPPPISDNTFQLFHQILLVLFKKDACDLWFLVYLFPVEFPTMECDWQTLFILWPHIHTLRHTIFIPTSTHRILSFD